MCWYGVLYAIGAGKLDTAQHMYSGRGIDTELVIAAGMPGSRAPAIELLGRRIAFPSTEPGLQTAVALDCFYGRCSAQRLFDAARFEEALMAAEICGTEYEEVEILIALGRYAEALALIDPITAPRQATTVLLANGRWRDAAAALTRVRDRDPALGCFAQLVEFYAGDARSRETLERESGSDDCGVIAALALGRRVRGTAKAHMLRDVVPLVATEPGWTVPAHFLYEASPELWQPPFENGGCGDVVMLDIVRGHLSAAHAGLASLRNADRELAIGVALHDGTELPPATEGELSSVYGAVEARRGRVEVDALDQHATLALNAAIGGDGRELARELERGYGFWPTMKFAMLVLAPGISVHRDELAAALRFFRNPRMGAEIDPFWRGRLRHVLSRHCARARGRRRRTALAGDHRSSRHDAG